MAGKGFLIRDASWGLARDVALPVAAITAAITLPFVYLVHAFIILGQAHFFLACLYQWRGKRVNSLYLATVLALVLAFGAYFLLDGGSLPLMIVISLLFSFHFAWDEFALHDEEMSRGRLVAIAGFAVSFFLLSLLYLYPAVVWLPVAAVAVALGALLVRFLLEHRPPSRGELYLWLVQALLFATALAFGLPGQVLAVIVILHVVNWYIAYGVRLAPNPDRARTYWREVVLSLFVLTALFVAFREFEVGVLVVLFGLGPYYAFAIAHILLSLVSLLPRRAS